MYIPTRELIQNTLIDLLNERSMDDITAKMVCQQAGISRQTLYNHYYCLLDVLGDVMARELDDATARCNTYLTWVAGFRAVLGYLEEHRSVVLHIYRSSSREELMNMLRAYGASLVKNGIEQCARDLQYDISEEDRQFMLGVYMDIFMGVTNRWLDRGMKPEPEYVASRVDAMLGYSIRTAMKRITEGIATTKNA